MKRAYLQYYATFVANLLIFIEGLSISWTSPNIPLLLSDTSPLPSGKMSQEEASFVTAAACFGGMLSTLFCGLLLDNIGRKRTLIFAGIPYSIGWWMIIVSQDVWGLCIGRFFSGFAGSIAFMSIPVFVSEVADDSRRGALGTILSFGCNIGILVGFVLSPIFDYFIIPILIEVTLVVFFISMFFIEESPRYLKQKGRIGQAKKALQFYNDNIDVYEQEIAGAEEYEEPEPFEWKDMKRPEYWKPTLMAIIGAPFSVCSGSFALITFTNQIFSESGSDIPAETACIIIASIQIVGSFVSTTAIERAGRKSLLLVSSLGCGTSLLIAGSYYYFKNLGVDVAAFSIIPLICVSFIFFIFAVGLASVPYVVFTEILPQKLKGTLMTFVIFEILGIMALGVRYFMSINNAYGMHGFMWFFSMTSFLGATLICVFLPETKGRRMDSIANLFAAAVIEKI